MNEQARRKELQAQYKQTRPEIGVYRIVNRENGRVLLGATTNLPSIRGKLEFAQSLAAQSKPGQRQSDTPEQTAALLRGRRAATGEDRGLNKDLQQHSIGAFSFEVLEVLEIAPDATEAQIKRDLAALEELWREKMDPALLY